MGESGMQFRPAISVHFAASFCSIRSIISPTFFNSASSLSVKRMWNSCSIADTRLMCASESQSATVAALDSRVICNAGSSSTSRKIGRSSARISLMYVLLNMSILGLVAMGEIKPEYLMLIVPPASLKAESRVVASDQPISFRLDVVAKNFANALTLALRNQCIQHHRLHSAFQDPATHNPQVNVQNAVFFPSDDDRNQAIVT